MDWEMDDTTIEEQSWRWRMLGKLTLEQALRESQVSEERVHEVIRRLARHSIDTEVFEKLAAILDVNDAGSVLLAVIGRGDSRVTSILLESAGYSLQESEALALCVNLESNTRVDTVALRYARIFGSSRGCELLGNTLTTNEALRTLLLPNTRMGPKAVKHLMNGLNENKSLQRLDIGNNLLGDEGVGYVAEMMRSNITLNKLQLHYTECGRSGAECLAGAFERNRSLRAFSIGGNPIRREGMDSLLRPFIHDGDSSSGKNVTLTSLSFERSESKHFSVKSLAEVLRTNRILLELEMMYVKIHTEDWVDTIIPALEDNKTLELLDVSGCDGLTESVAGPLMKLVQKGKTGLKRINVASTGLSIQGGLINEELRKNSVYRSTLRDQRMVPSESARVVMCGYELAGKTTICLTASGATPTKLKLMWKKFLQRHSHLRQFLYGSRAHLEMEERTRGFDILYVQFRKYQDKMCVWDFAGQKEYYFLHDYLFPNSGNSCFLYVCSARSSPDAIKEQFEIQNQFSYWLRFIASNSTIVEEDVSSGKQKELPRVIFVLTNKDTLTAEEFEEARQRATYVLDDCKIEFKSRISFSEVVQIIDGHSRRDVRNVFDTVKEQLDQILKATQEYEICEDVRKILKEWVAAHPSFPLLSVEEFNTKVPKALTTEVREKVLAYLNDTGEIIYVDGFRYIVVNPRWFGVGLFGHLISIVQHRAAPGTGSKSGVLGYFKPVQRDWKQPLQREGFVERGEISRLLQKSLEAVENSPNSSISTDELIDLMIKLDIAFEEGGQSRRLFIPALLDDNVHKDACDGKRQLIWRAKFPPMEGIHIVGRRLECKDKSHTFLTPGFFPRLQVVLRNYLCSQGWQYEVASNLIYFVVGGKEVQIEYSGDIDYFVDILIRYSSRNEVNPQAHETTLRFLEEHIVMRIREFCASPQGCQGVELAEAVIWPKYLRGPEPSLCIRRQPHAVRVSDLEEGVKREGEAYRHTWKHQETTEVAYYFDYAMDLLKGDGSFERFVAGSHLVQADPHTGSSRSDYLRTNIPKHFFPTIENVGFAAKLESKTSLAKAIPLKLHILCDGLEEGENGVHKVEGQPGREMILNENSGRRIPLLNYALRILWSGAKVGAGTVNVALNDRDVDDWVCSLFKTEDVGINVPKLEQLIGIKKPKGKASVTQILKSLEEYMKKDPATEWMTFFLKVKDSPRFSADFKLTKARCIHSHSDVRWLCDKHFNEGFRDGLYTSEPH